jgi:hypothetical protein
MLVNFIVPTYIEIFIFDQTWTLPWRFILAEYIEDIRFKLHGSYLHIYIVTKLPRRNLSNSPIISKYIYRADNEWSSFSKSV